MIMSPTAKNTHADSEIATVNIPKKFQFTIAQIGALIFFLGAGGVTGFWLYNDRHNDDRYVQQSEYAKDSAQDEKDQKALEQKVDDVARDVRQVRDILLKRSNP